MFILVQTIKTVTIRPEIHLTQTRTIIRVIYHDSYLKTAPPRNKLWLYNEQTSLDGKPKPLAKTYAKWVELTDGMAQQVLIVSQTRCSPFDLHHILIKYWRLFPNNSVCPVVNCPKIQQQQQQNCQGAGVSDQLGGDSGAIGSSRPGFYISFINFFLSIARSLF